MNGITKNMRRAGLALAVAGVAAVAMPAAASAAQSSAPHLAPGQQACITQPASYQVRAVGTASNLGARFKLLRDGVVVAGSGSGTAPGWTGELRSSYGNFPGAGYYTFCVTNNNATGTKTTLLLLTDGEI